MGQQWKQTIISQMEVMFSCSRQNMSHEAVLQNSAYLERAKTNWNFEKALPTPGVSFFKH